MDPRSRRRAQMVAFDGKQMPSGSAEDRLCDLDGCPRRSETLVASTDGSVLLVCTSCATQMSAPAADAASRREPAPRTEPMRVVPRLDTHAWDDDDTRELPVIRDEVAAPPARPTAAAPGRGRRWSFWLGLVIGTALTVWGLVLMAGDAGALDAVVTAAIGVYLLLNVTRPRYRD